MPARTDHGCASGCRTPGSRQEASPCALRRAVAVQGRARRKGFDWDEAAEALEKVREETEEVAAALALEGAEMARPEGAGAVAAASMSGSARQDNREDLADSPLAGELGDLLFAATNVARMTGIDPAAALAGATTRFEARFAEVERIARRRGLPMPGTPLAELDRIWDEVKRSFSRNPPDPHHSGSG